MNSFELFNCKCIIIKHEQIISFRIEYLFYYLFTSLIKKAT